MNNLKKCPFCGGAVTVAKYENWWSVIASGNDPKLSCRCRVFMESELFHDEESKQRAKENLIEKWNRRADEGKQGKFEEISTNFSTGKPTEEGWYLLKIKSDDEIIYDTNKLINCIYGMDWRYEHGEILGWQKIKE